MCSAVTSMIVGGNAPGIDAEASRIVRTRSYRSGREQIAMAAPTNGRVLIFGENGTGKELVARSIHAQSRRRAAPFVEVNCAAIPEELIESELFGAVKGAYTGSTNSRDGKFLQAHQGTLFLDEVGDMSLKAQAKANPGQVVDLVAKGVSFGTLSYDSRAGFDTSNVEGVDDDLVIKPFGRKGEFSSIRQFDIGALQFHMGMQAVELVGVEIDFSIGQAERIEHPGSEESLVVHSRAHRQGVSQQARTEIGVLVLLAGCPNQ